MAIIPIQRILERTQESDTKNRYPPEVTGNKQQQDSSSRQSKKTIQKINKLSEITHISINGINYPIRKHRVVIGSESRVHLFAGSKKHTLLSMRDRILGHQDVKGIPSILQISQSSNNSIKKTLDLNTIENQIQTLKNVLSSQNPK